jgi:hypothetical protein
LPIFRLSKAFCLGRGAKVFLNLQGGLTREAVPPLERPKEQFKKPRNVTSGERQPLKRKIKEQAKNLRKERRRNERQRKELLHQRLEIFQLRSELNAINELVENAQDGPSAPQVSSKQERGALPDFVVIGAPRCGTSQFYGLLTRHPNVERAAIKEVHFFDRPTRFDKRTEWYRLCFPPPKWKNGRRSITGEATPSYLSDPLVPERMAKVIPQARLIVLLRNPVDRAYSHYHLLARRGSLISSFEEVIEAEQAWLLDEKNKPSKHERRSSASHGPPSKLLITGIYMDHLLRWRRFFSDEQMLVLKSENFFQHTADTLKLVQDFLGLPYWNLDLQRRRTKARYKPMSPATRRRLEEYFEPHNQRLYEHLGVDFGWQSRTLDSSSHRAE